MLEGATGDTIPLPIPGLLAGMELHRANKKHPRQTSVLGESTIILANLD